METQKMRQQEIAQYNRRHPNGRTQDVSETHKLTVCRRCDKQRLCAKESRLCSNCASILISNFLTYIALPGLIPV